MRLRYCVSNSIPFACNKNHKSFTWLASITMKRITGEEFIGQTFHRLTVNRVIGFDPRRGAIVECKCSCGRLHEAKLGGVRNGDVKSCGCLLRDVLSLPTSSRKPLGRKRTLDPVAHRAAQIRWAKKNKKKMAAAAKRFRNNHKSKVQSEKAAWYQKAKPKIYAKAKHRFATDINFRIQGLFTGRVRKALRVQKAIKSKRMLQLLGCTLPQFRVYLQSLFTDGMSWDALKEGRIHIDHVTPLRSFNLKDPAEQLIAFNFKNHQPLWEPDNLSKSDLLPDGTRARYIIHPEVMPSLTPEPLPVS